MAEEHGAEPVAMDVRLDRKGDEQPILLMIVGVALMSGAIACAILGSGLAGWISAGVLALVGVLLFLPGWRWQSTYATQEGLLRTGRAGRELVPWADVAVIELEANHDPELVGSSAVSLLRLRLADGRRMTIRCKPAGLDHRASVVREHCPHAFVSDARTGEIHQPTTGDAEGMHRREAVVKGRASRRQVGIVLLWGMAALLSAAGTVALFLVAFRGGAFGVWAGASILLFGTLMALRSLRHAISDLNTTRVV